MVPNSNPKISEKSFTLDTSGNGLKRLGGLASLVSNNSKPVHSKGGNRDRDKKKISGKSGFDLEGVCKDITRWEADFEERTNVPKACNNWI